MGLFSRASKTSGESASRDVMKGHLHGTSTAFEADIIAAGQDVRVAIERQDPQAALKAFQRRESAKAKAQGYPGSDGFTLSGAGTIEEAFRFTEVTEVGLSPSRIHDMRQALALAAAMGISSADLVVSVLLGLDTPTPWPGFVQEREYWRGSTQKHDKWNDRLLSEPPTVWAPESLQGLSLDARQVLSMPKCVKRIHVVSSNELAKRTLLPYARLDSAVQELRARGLATDPTLKDRLSMATVAQLKELHGAVGLDGRGTKPKLVEGLKDVNDERALATLQLLVDGVSPALPGDICLGLGAGKESDYFFAYADMMADWLDKTLSRSSSVRRPATGKGWDVLVEGDCPKCAAAPRKVARNAAHHLPPFHIGCMCLELLVL